MGQWFVVTITIGMGISVQVRNIKIFHIPYQPTISSVIHYIRIYIIFYGEDIYVEK